MSTGAARPSLTKALLAAVVCAVGTLTAFRLPLWCGPLYGDDFLLVDSALQPNGRSSFSSDFFLVGSGKWRPLNTPFLLMLARWFGFDYRPYQILNIALLLFCASIIGVLVFEISQSLFSSSLAAIAAASSPYTWMGQISVYGLMEFSAVFMVLFALFFELRGIFRDNSSPWNHRLAFVCLIAATLIHERMLTLCLAFGMFHWFCSRNQRQAFSYTSILFIHIFLKGFFLQLNIGQSGGESDLQAVAGSWILQHMLASFGAILGMTSGAGIFYSRGTLRVLSENSNLNFVGLGVVLIGFSAAALIGNKFIGIRSLSKNSRHALTLICFTLFASVFSISLVKERIEGRWLFLPQSLLVLLVIAGLSHGLRKNGHWLLRGVISLLAIVGLLTTNAFYRTQARNFTFLRDQPSLMIREVEKSAPRSKPWVLVVGHTDATIPQKWQVGYGRAFNQLRNPPWLVSWGDSDLDCPQIRLRVRCIVVVMTGTSLRPEISRTWSYGYQDS